MGKAVLIFLLGSMAIFGVITIFNNNNVKSALGTSVNYYSDNQARDIGNSTMQMILSQLADSNSWRTPGTISFFNGSAPYTIVDTSFAGISLVKVNVYANYRGTPKTITAYFIPPDTSYKNYALLTGGDLTTSASSFNVSSSPSGMNANVLADGNVTMSGTSTVNGFLNYSGTLTLSGTQIITPP